MRSLLLTCLITSAAVVGCHQGDLENRASSAEAAAEREREGRLAADAQRNEALALAREREAVGNVITTFQVVVRLHCAAIEGRTVEHPRAILSGISLIQADGSAWRLVESPDHNVEIAEAPDGSWDVTWTYVPEDIEQIVGRPITDLQSVKSVGLRYEQLLENIGLTLVPNGTADLWVRVNGIETVVAERAPLTADEAGASSFDVSAQFANTFVTYTQGLQQRAGTH
jgi:hypothetical protein